MSELIGIFVMIPLFIYWWIQGRKKGKERQKELERLQNHLDTIEIYNELSDGFIVRQANKSPYYNTIHRSKCNHAKRPNNLNMNSSWKGYFASHQDAVEFSELQGFSIYDCSFCKPHEKPTISKTVRKEFTDGYSDAIKHENDSIEEIVLLIRILEGSPDNEQEIDMLNGFPGGQYRRGYLKKLKEIQINENLSLK